MALAVSTLGSLSVGDTKRTFFLNCSVIVDWIKSLSVVLLTGSVKHMPPLEIRNIGVGVKGFALGESFEVVVRSGPIG